MTRPAFIEIDGKHYRWRDLIALRQNQLRAYAAAVQQPLFALIADCRPQSQQTASGRYTEPILFDR